MKKEKESHPEFRVGTTLVTTTPVQLTTLSLRACKSVRIQATTGTIYVGHDSSVTLTTGWALDGTVEISVDDPSKIWVVSDSPRTANWLAV